MDRLTELLDRKTFPNGLQIIPCKDGTYCISTTYKGSAVRAYDDDILTAVEKVIKKMVRL